MDSVDAGFQDPDFREGSFGDGDVDGDDDIGSSVPSGSLPSGQDRAGSAPVIKRRAPIACRRCRRMRSKCIHEKATPPCKACIEAGLGAEDCIFPVRGQPDNDREYRHPRMRATKVSKRNPARIRRGLDDATPVQPTEEEEASSWRDNWADLPPMADIIDAVERFTKHYFQLSFIPRQQYFERLRRDRRSINVFLMLGILSISARLTPAMVKRYGSSLKAADYFMDRASRMAVGEIYQEPTLERCQGFYLLSIAQQGSGQNNKSSMNMGIAVRMAGLMQLHREETYQISGSTKDQVIRAESARRTLWMLHSQDCLHAGPATLVSLAATDITALLPCEEEDFASGRIPSSRAALQDTLPAVDDPAKICDPARSLFASLMQVHHLWGTVGRRAVKYARCPRPWDSTSEFCLMRSKLREWEQGLPAEHRWSPELLRLYKSKGQDLAYLGVTMMPRLCNVVLRRPYLEDIIHINSKNAHEHAFFSTLSIDLFRNVRELFIQIDAQFADRSPDESVGAQMAAFCVFSCGLFSAYLSSYPSICPDPEITPYGPAMLQRTKAILKECQEVWPLAGRWVDVVDKAFRDPHDTSLTSQGTMADGQDPVPHALGPITLATPLPSTASRNTERSKDPNSPPPSQRSPPEKRMSSFSSTSTFSTQQQQPQPLQQLPQRSQRPSQRKQPSHESQHQQPPAPHRPPPAISQRQSHRTTQQPTQAPQIGQQNTPYHPPIGFPTQFTQPSPAGPPSHPVASQNHHDSEPPPAIPSQMYIPQHNPMPNPAPGMAMMSNSFEGHHQVHPPSFDMPADAPSHSSPAYISQIGPGNDGFEGELQYYIGYPQGWTHQQQQQQPPPGGWSDGY